MVILGLETSCDDTACAIGKYEKGVFSILSNVISSQVKLHAQWGGIVPNLAAREHLKNILPVIKESLRQANISPQKIDLITVTHGPGLIPSLLVGVGVAKTLAYLWKKPLLGINHLEGHIYANFISDKISVDSKFPILCLIVSGGHTQLVLVKKSLDYKIIGETLDDAVGESFDKVARILNLGYPGGPVIAKQAENFLKKNHPSSKDLPLIIKFPRPMLHSQNFNFSFSGLKTAVLYLVKKNQRLLANQNFIDKVCYEFQQATIDVLIYKTIKAIKRYRTKTVLLGGGVSANQELRQQFKKNIKKEFPNIKYSAPDIKYCGDNAAMIATAGFWRWKQKKDKKIFQQEIKNNWKNLKTEANLSLGFNHK